MNLLVDRGGGVVIGGGRRVVVGGVANHPADNSEYGEKIQQCLQIRFTESQLLTVMVWWWYLHDSSVSSLLVRRPTGKVPLYHRAARDGVNISVPFRHQHCFHI